MKGILMDIDCNNAFIECRTNVLKDTFLSMVAYMFSKQKRPMY